jgi:hypothetical protein
MASGGGGDDKDGIWVFTGSHQKIDISRWRVRTDALSSFSSA